MIAIKAPIGYALDMAGEQCDLCDHKGYQARLINRNGHVTSFLSNPRLIGASVHALVIPNRHLTPGMPLDRYERHARDTEIEILRALMLGPLSLKGADVWQKSRPDEPETAIKRDHLHWHVIGSKPGDEVYDRGIIWTPDHFTGLTDEDIAKWLPALQAAQ